MARNAFVHEKAIFLLLPPPLLPPVKKTVVTMETRMDRRKRTIRPTTPRKIVGRSPSPGDTHRPHIHTRPPLSLATTQAGRRVSLQPVSRLDGTGHINPVQSSRANCQLERM